MTRLARNTASSTSWVTRSAVKPARCHSDTSSCLHGDARQGIELAQWLVENEKLRIVHQCPRKRRALRHSARKLAWISRGETREADQAQSVVDAFAMASKQSTRFEPERNIAPHRPPRIKRWVLKNDDA